MANDSLTRGHIIGDVLDPFTSSVPLTVMYDGRPVFDGMEFRASEVSMKPRVEIGGDDFRVAYTLVSHHFADRVHWWWPYIWPTCRDYFLLLGVVTPNDAQEQLSKLLPKFEIDGLAHCEG